MGVSIHLAAVANDSASKIGPDNVYGIGEIRAIIT